MAYRIATVVEAIQEADGRIRMNISYTGDAGEPEVRLPSYVNQSAAPGANDLRSQAMNQLQILNVNRTVFGAIALPQVLDTLTALPAPVAAKALTSYMAASLPFTPGTVLQDVFTITGSATKTITIIRAGLSTLQTTGGINTWYLLRRSTANSAGTSVAVAAIPTTDTFAAASATVLQYTVNPTAGTLLGRLWTGRVGSPAPGTVGIGDSEKILLLSDRTGLQPVTLTGVNDVLAWNFNGATLPAGLSVTAHFWWTEI